MRLVIRGYCPEHDKALKHDVTYPRVPVMPLPSIKRGGKPAVIVTLHLICPGSAAGDYCREGWSLEAQAGTKDDERWVEVRGL